MTVTGVQHNGRAALKLTRHDKIDNSDDGELDMLTITYLDRGTALPFTQDNESTVFTIKADNVRRTASNRYEFIARADVPKDIFAAPQPSIYWLGQTYTPDGLPPLALNSTEDVGNGEVLLVYGSTDDRSSPGVLTIADWARADYPQMCPGGPAQIPNMTATLCESDGSLAVTLEVTVTKTVVLISAAPTQGPTGNDIPAPTPPSKR